VKIFAELKRTTKLLNEYQGQWALCGGVAASIYREKARFTDDIDFALVDSPNTSAVKLASKIIGQLGYKEYKGFVPDAKNGQQILGLVCARDEEDKRFAGLDFLLPVQAWVQDAVEIAQNNLISYGFAELPTITPECLILAKLTALISNPERYQDLDDITEILKTCSTDQEYLAQKIKEYNLVLTPKLASMIQR